MTNLDFGKTTFGVPKRDKIVVGTPDASVDFLETFGADEALKRALSVLQRGPTHFNRNNVIVHEGDAGDRIFFVVSGGCAQLQNVRKWRPQHRRLLCAWRCVWLVRTDPVALSRSSDGCGGALCQTQRVAVHRIPRNSSSEFL